MPILDNSVLVPDSGNFLLANVGTPLPADLFNPTVGGTWDFIGHTALEDIFGSESEGGETSIISTLQKRALRSKTSPRTETWAIPLQQFDPASIKLYFAANAAEVEGGRALSVPSRPRATEKAFLALFYDGDALMGLYAPKAEIKRGDDFSIGAVDELATLPLGVTPIAYATNDWPFSVIPITRDAAGV